jgi:hypothetical protein
VGQTPAPGRSNPVALLYLNDKGNELYIEALNSGLDNPFLCEVCAEESDDLRYVG